MRGFVSRRWARHSGFSVRHIGVEIFKTEVQLIRIEPLRPAAKLASLKLADDEPELLDLATLLLFLRHKVAHEAVQQGRICRQIRKI